jgi:ribonuclease E
VTVPEPAPAEAPPAETADKAATPAKPARKRRSKKADEAPAQAESASVEAIPLLAANNDTAEEPGGEPRRGWWQKTFG